MTEAEKMKLGLEMHLEIRLAEQQDIERAIQYDSHIPVARFLQCVENGQVYLLLDAETVLGVLRYSLFWQTIPFLEHIYLAESARGQGFGTRMMQRWENDMREMGFSAVMTSTQADETAWMFYEKRGYRRIGAFLPPLQEAQEWMYWKDLESCVSE